MVISIITGKKSKTEKSENTTLENSKFPEQQYDEIDFKGIKVKLSKSISTEQFREIQKLTKGNINRFIKNDNIRNFFEKENIAVEIIISELRPNNVSLFSTHGYKVTFKNCTFKDNSQIYIQDNDVTFDGCTFGDGVSIHSLKENANVTIKDSKLPKKIESSVNQAQRILDRERALKFFGTFRGLTLQNNYDAINGGNKILGGLIDAANAEIKDGGIKQPIIFKDQKEKPIAPKDILKLYGGSLIKKSNLGTELYEAQIEVKKHDLEKRGRANLDNNAIEEECVISKNERILRSVSLVDDTFTYKKNLEKYVPFRERKDKEVALKSVEATREKIARTIKQDRFEDVETLKKEYDRILKTTNCEAVKAKIGLPENEEVTTNLSSKFSSKVSNFFKKQFKKWNTEPEEAADVQVTQQVRQTSVNSTEQKQDSGANSIKGDTQVNSNGTSDSSATATANASNQNSDSTPQKGQDSDPQVQVTPSADNGADTSSQNTDCAETSVSGTFDLVWNIGSASPDENIDKKEQSDDEEDHSSLERRPFRISRLLKSLSSQLEEDELEQDKIEKDDSKNHQSKDKSSSILRRPNPNR